MHHKIYLSKVNTEENHRKQDKAKASSDKEEYTLLAVFFICVLLSIILAPKSSIKFKNNDNPNTQRILQK